MDSSRGDREEEETRVGLYEGEPPTQEEGSQDDSDLGGLEVEERFPDAAQVGRASLERWERAADAATRGASVSEVMRELQGDEEEDEYEALEEKQTIKEEPPTRVDQAAEIKAEPKVKEEPGAPTRRAQERMRTQPPRQPPRGYARGLPTREEEEGEFYDALEEPSSPKRSPSGFIPHYTGPEARRTDRPAFGWSWSAQRESRSAPRYPGWEEQGAPVKQAAFSLPPAKMQPYGDLSPKVPMSYDKSPMTAPFTGQMQGQHAPFALKSHGQTVPQARVLPRVTNSSGRQGTPPNDYNLSTMVSHAVKVLPMFYSDTATVEKARDFWELFEDHTDGFPDRSRLLVFRQKIKGREAERWWNNSRIKSFRTLKVRFHNQFLSRTADELWERLETTKRERGESVEEWGDRVSDLCESLDYPNPQMRYQLFRRGLRNKRMLATLDASPASDIPEACEWLMFKDMHRPIEEDDEFSESEPAKKSKSPAAGAASVEALTLQLKNFMEQQQQWQEQLAQRQWQPPRSPRNRAPVVAAAQESVPPNDNPSQTGGQPFRGIRLGDDSRTQDGAPVCGRCNFKGHGRATCKRATMSCRRCGVLGHIAVECERPPDSAPRTTPTGGGRQPYGVCYFCREPGHSVAACPALVALRELIPMNMGIGGSAGSPAPRQ